MSHLDDQSTDPTHIRHQLNVLALAESFYPAAVLFALLKLNIFELIGHESKASSVLAMELGCRSDTLSRILNAGVALRLLDTPDHVQYQLTPMARSVLLSSAGDSYLGPWIRNLEYFSAALSRLDQAILRSSPSIDARQHRVASNREFILAMHNYASLRGKELARYLNIRDSKTLLDLGCGPGTYAFHLAQTNPQLQLFLADFPEVLHVAREIRARYDMPNDTSYLPLDVLTQDIPGFYDVILVSNLLHMLGGEASQSLLQRLYKSVNQGGFLVVQAQFLEDGRLGKRWPTMLDLTLLCVTPAGRNHAVEETKEWLKNAGFSRIDVCPMSMLNTNSFLRAQKS